MSSNIEKIIVLSPVEARAGMLLLLDNYVNKKCPTCRGAGRIHQQQSNLSEQQKCQNCGASGIVITFEEIEVEIKPIDISSNEFYALQEKRILFEGLGNFSHRNQMRGNLILCVKVDRVLVKDEDRDFIILSYGNLENFKELFDKEQESFRLPEKTSTVQSEFVKQKFWLEDFEKNEDIDLEDSNNERDEEFIEENADIIYQPLIRMATPNLYESNAFRLLGILPGATEREIKKTIDKITKLRRVGGTLEDSQFILPVLEIDDEMLVIADQVMQNAESRFLHEFFWIYPADLTGERENTGLISSLQNNDIEEAIETLKSEIFTTGGIYTGKNDFSGRKLHSLTVLLHLRSLKSNVDWEGSQACWEKLYSCDSFWDFLKNERVVQIDNPLVRASNVYQIRNTLPRFLQTLSARLALRCAERGNYTGAEEYIYLISSNWLDEGVGSEILLEVVQPKKDQIQNFCENFDLEIERAQNNKALIIKNFLDQTMPAMRVLGTLLGAKNSSTIDWGDRIINHARNASVSLANKTRNWREGLSINSLLRYFPQSLAMTKRLNEDENKLKVWLFESEIEPLCNKAAEACEKDITQTPTIVKNFVIGGKNLIKSINTENTVDVNWADTIVEYARRLVIKYGNETENWEECLALQSVFWELAESEDLKKQLAEDEKDLTSRFHEKDVAKLLDEAVESSNQAFPPAPYMVKDLLTKCREIIEKKSKEIGANNKIILNLKEIVFQVVFGLLIDYVNKKEDYTKTSEIFAQLKYFVITKEQQKKFADNLETLKKNEEFFNRNVLCWFCHEEKGDVVSQVKVSMYGDVERERFFNRRKVTWRNLEVTVQRCISCDAIHLKKSKAIAKGIAAGLLIAILINLPLFFLYSYLVKFEMIYLDAFITVGFIWLSYDIAVEFNRILQPKKIDNLRMKYQHPDILELKSRGWIVGTKPSA